MISLGQMVRAGGSAPMKVVDLSNDVAECIWIDGNGCIRRRFHAVESLTPMWVALGPKSLWPESGNLSRVEEEKEERVATAARRAKAAVSRKPRRSKRIKRGGVTP